jgi:hypothetical protein
MITIGYNGNTLMIYSYFRNTLYIDIAAGDRNAKNTPL